MAALSLGDHHDDSFNTGHFEVKRHKLWRIALDGRLHVAPFRAQLLQDDDQHHQPTILDVGAGDCRWAVDFALQNPHAIVYAVDIHVDQVPRTLPANCIFTLADFTQSWAEEMPDFGQLDFIHTRDLSNSIPNLRAFIRSAYSALKPGGFFEMQDFDEPKKLGPGHSQCLDRIRWAIEDDLDEQGISWYNVPRYRRCLEDAGFEPATETCTLMPTSPQWPVGEASTEQRTMARLYQEMVGAGLLETEADNCSQRSQAWTEQEFHKVVTGAKQEMLDNELKIAYQLKAVWGCKPPSPDVTNIHDGSKVVDETWSEKDFVAFKDFMRSFNSKL